MKQGEMQYLSGIHPVPNLKEIWFFQMLSSQRQAPHNACTHPIKHTQRNNIRYLISIGNKVNWISLKSSTRAGEHHHIRYDQNMTTANFKFIYPLFYFFQFKVWSLLKFPFVGVLTIPGHLSFHLCTDPVNFAELLCLINLLFLFKLTSRG